MAPRDRCQETNRPERGMRFHARVDPLKKRADAIKFLGHDSSARAPEPSKQRVRQLSCCGSCVALTLPAGEVFTERQQLVSDLGPLALLRGSSELQGVLLARSTKVLQPRIRLLPRGQALLGICLKARRHNKCSIPCQRIPSLFPIRTQSLSALGHPQCCLVGSELALRRFELACGTLSAGKRVGRIRIARPTRLAFESSAGGI